MSFMSRILIISKTSVYSRALFRLLPTTGTPTQCLSRLCYQNSLLSRKYPNLIHKGTKLLSNRNYTTYKKLAGVNYGRAESVQKLVDVYVSMREHQCSMSALNTLDSILKCTRKSVKEAVVLLQDSDTSNKFHSLLQDIEVNLDSTPQMQSIVSVLSSLTEIFVRQKTFCNQTDIDIYTNNVTSSMKNYYITSSTDAIKIQESHATDIVRNLFVKCESLILSNTDHVSSENLVNILWCYAGTGYGTKQFYEELTNRISGLRTAELTNEDISKVVCSFAQIKWIADLTDIISKIEEEILQRGIVSLQKDQIVNVLFAFANLQHENKELYQEILTEILNRNARSFMPVQICKILWSFTKVSPKQDLNLSDLFNRFESEINRKGVKHFDVRGLSVITWAFVETQRFPKHLLSSLRNEITRRNIKTFTADDLSILLRSLAKVKNRIHANKFFSKTEKELLGRGLALFTNRHLATVLWSFAETGHGSPAFYDMMKRVVFERGTRELTSLEFSQVVWSLAKAKDRTKVKDFLLQVEFNVTKLSLRQLALVLWSYAATDVLHVKLITDLNRQISKQDLAKANSPMICQIMFGLATFKEVAPPQEVTGFFEKYVGRSNIKLFEHRQLAILVWSFCELSQFCESTKIFEILIKDVCSRSSQRFMPADLCRILLGFSQVHHLTDTTVVFLTLTKELLRRGLSEFSTAQVTMAAVAMSTANQWDAELVQLFEEEIVTRRNSRSFDGTDLSSFAKAFLKMNPLDSVKLFCWLEDEVISRNVNTFSPKDLVQTLGVLLHQNATKLHFFQTVKDQLLESNFKNYSKDEVSNVCALLVKAGIDSQIMQLVD